MDTIRGAGGEVLYRLRRGAFTHYLACRECGRSVEVDGREIWNWAQRAVAQAGFTPSGALCELAYASVRQTSSRVCAAMVAAVLVSRPQKVCAPWRASSMRSVISLKVVSTRLRHSAMTFSRMAGVAARCFLPGGTRTAVPQGPLEQIRGSAPGFLNLVLPRLRDYCRRVIVAAALAGLVVFVVAWLALAARLVHLGNLDALALAEKVAVPEPDSALDWPDLHLRAVVAQPDDQSLVLLHVIWPARPGQAAMLLVALDQGDRRSLPLLTRWCACHASVCPMRRPGAGLELRRGQSLGRVHALLVAEDTAPAG